MEAFGACRRFLLNKKIMSINFAATTQRSQLADNIDAVRNVPGATLCGWVKLTSKSALQCLSSLTVNTDRIYGRCSLYPVATDTIHIRVAGQPLDIDPSASFVTAALSLSVGVWSFVAATFDYVNRYMKAYLNTSSETSPLLTSWTSGNCSNTTTLANTIGNKDPTFANYPLNGLADDVRIYNRILTDAELQTIYACRGTDGIILGLQARYLFNSKQSGFVTVGGEKTVDISGKYHGVYSAGCTYQESVLQIRKNTP